MHPAARSYLRILISHVAFLTCVATGAAAQSTEIGGQVRPRWENRSFAPDPAVSMRTRAHVRHARDWGTAFVQIQDVRFWGSEFSTTGDFSADAIDVHEAWIMAGRDSMYARIGRQEIGFGEERLIGPANWLQQGRSFDGMRGHVVLGPVELDVVGVQLLEEASTGVEQALATLYAAWSPAPYRVEGYMIGDGDDEWRVTSGSRVVGTTAGFDWRVEGSVQRGAVAPPFAPDLRDVRAWMAGARVSHAVGPASVTLLYDHLSGDDAPADSTIRVFDTLFGTNHKFYGYADLFTDIPLHTGRRGLGDAALIVAGSIVGNTLELGAHRFDAVATDGLESGRFGEEIDLTLGRVIGEGLQLSGGVSWFGSGPAFEAVRGIADDIWFGYVAIDARF